jgi:hypothetical protein
MRSLSLWALLTTCILLLVSPLTPAQWSVGNSETNQKTEATSDAVNAEQYDIADTVSLNPMRASYSASLEKGIPFKGSAVRSLEQQEDGTWIYRSDVDSFIADIRESTHLRWDGERVTPTRYRYSLEGMMIRDRADSIDFNWEQQIASGEHEGDPFQLEIPQQALDPLGYQLQLMQDLKKGKEKMRYQVVDEDDLDEDVFAVLGEEQLDSELGPVTTIKMEKVRSPKKKRQTLMWFAPEWDYLLVRFVQIEDDGTRYEINLESAEVDGREITGNK